MSHSNLKALGWDPWFEEKARLRCDPEGAVARVAAVDRDQWLLLDETGAFRAKLSGKLMHESASPLELPCVGDWVCVERSPADQFGLIRGVLRPKKPGQIGLPPIPRTPRQAHNARGGVRGIGGSPDLFSNTLLMHRQKCSTLKSNRHEPFQS